MTNPTVRFARLDREKMEAIRALEESLGKVIVAFEPVIRLADLSPEEIARLKEAEQELGVVLVAYDES